MKSTNKNSGNQKIVIIGGVAAGASAAAKARRMNEDVDITILESGPYISFANCGLPYYVGGEIEERDKLFVTSAEDFSRRYRVEILTEATATEVDRQKQMVHYTKNGVEKTVQYDRLILATGTNSIHPNIPGLRDHQNIFTLRTVPDVDQIRSFLKTRLNQEGVKALIIGGGYIGLEAAEQLLRFDIEVTLIEIAEQLMTPMDPEMSLPIERALRESGARIILGDGLKEIIRKNGMTYGITDSGHEIEFDIALLCVGVRPAVELAIKCGLSIGSSGAIQVDKHQRTSDSKIFAAGDNSETMHLVTKKPVNIPLAGPANKAGRVAGDNAARDLLNSSSKYDGRLESRGVLGTAVVRVCDQLAAVTGITEKTALAEEIPYEVTYMSGNSHASYYPGSEPILLKILTAPTGVLLGAQGVGGTGVDKRIDVLATAIMAGMKIEDLEHLDLTYAPPVGSAKDIPIMAGFAGSNSRRGVMPQITPTAFFKELQTAEDYFILDVRTFEEFSEGHLEAAVNIPVDDLRERLSEIPRGPKVFVYCRGGYRSYLATRILLNHGWQDVRNIQGGFTLISQVVESFRLTAEKN